MLKIFFFISVGKLDRSYKANKALMNLVFNSTGPLLDHLDLEHINWISLSFDSFQTAGLARPYWRTFPCYRYGSFSFSLVRAFPTDGITSTRVESTKPKKKNKQEPSGCWPWFVILLFVFIFYWTGAPAEAAPAAASAVPDRCCRPSNCHHNNKVMEIWWWPPPAGFPPTADKI